MGLFDNLDWGSWVYGLFAGFIGGGSSAVSAAVVVGIKDPKDYALGGWNSLHLMFWVFLVSGLISAFTFLKQNPLPNKITVTTTTEKQTLPTQPPTQFTRRIEETVTSTSTATPALPLTKEETKP